MLIKKQALLSFNMIYHNIIKIAFGILGPIAITYPHNIVVIFVTIALCGIFSLTWEDVKTLPSNKIFISIGILWLWVTYSNLWTPHPLDGLVLSLKLLSIIVCGWVCFKNFQKTEEQVFLSYLKYLACGLIFAIIFIAGDSLAGHMWHKIKGVCITKAFAQASMIIALVLWSTLPLLSSHKKYVALFTLLSLWSVECDSGTYGLILGIIVSILAGGYPCFMLKQFKILTPFSLLLFPLLFVFINQKDIYGLNHYFYNASYIHRLYIWHSNAQDIIKQPLIGYGLNSSRYRYETLPTQELAVKGSYNEYSHAQAPATCVHPHNIAIQLWYELGLIGVLLCSMIFYYLLQAVSKSSPRYIPWLLGFYTTAQFIAWFSLGFWQNWWLSILFLVGALLARLSIHHRSYRLST